MMARIRLDRMLDGLRHDLCSEMLHHNNIQTYKLFFMYNLKKSFISLCMSNVIEVPVVIAIERDLDESDQLLPGWNFDLV